MPTCALVFLAKNGMEDELLMQYAARFILPAVALFRIFFLILETTRIMAFAQGRTPCPKWCRFFPCPLVCFLQCCRTLSETAPLSTPFPAHGLPVMMKKAQMAQCAACQRPFRAKSPAKQLLCGAMHCAVYLTSTIVIASPLTSTSERSVLFIAAACAASSSPSVFTMMLAVSPLR